MKPEFELLGRDTSSLARWGRIVTTHGTVETPVFMPVGTQATVKSLDSEDLERIGCKIILSNTYHLYLRPGMDVITHFGGLHHFMGWKRPILTDSGGFQVLSLARIREISDEGVLFHSHIDGSKHFMTPEKAVEIQEVLGADIVMSFDECTPYPVDHSYARKAMERTIEWAIKGKQRHRNNNQALFGIVQGSIFNDLRMECLSRLMAVGFDGYALGSLSVGEPKETMLTILEQVIPSFPQDKPRYLMGVGTPEDIVEGVKLGVDMFDCVLPTRNARNGTLFTSFGKINIKGNSFIKDESPIDPECTCYTCRNFSRAYLRHLYVSKELIAYRLNTIHNVYYYINFIKEIQSAIKSGKFIEWRRKFYLKRSIYNEDRLRICGENRKS